jgi:hypothetical protein
VISIGVISDTHGLIRPEALDALRGSELVVHAGDVGGPEVLAALRNLAPVYAVRGNNDRGAWARALPKSREVVAGSTLILVIHDLKTLAVADARRGCRVVVSGHSHRPSAEEREGVLYLNPGSAGPRRFRLPVSIARLWIDSDGVQHELIALRA